MRGARTMHVRLRGAGRWSFPAVAWFLACFFLLGNLGLWLDDYYYVQREPASLRVEALYLERWIHFWRPLYKAIVPTLLTAGYRHSAALHLLNALAHGMVATTLWGLLWTLGVNRLSATAAALLFLTWPVHFEPVFWVSALPTVLGAWLGLMTLLLTVHWARGTAPRWCVSLLLPALFAVACLNEQPAMLALALPVVVLAAGPARGDGRFRWLARLGIPLGLAGVAGLLYAGIHAVVVEGKPAIGYDTYVVPLARWPDHVLKAARWSLDWNSLDGFAARAWERGLEAFGRAPVRACAVLSLAGVTGALWLGAQAATGDDRRPGSQSSHAALMGLGVVVLGASWAPIVAFNYWLNPRVCYVPNLGLAILLATAGSRLACGSGAAAGPARVRRLMAATAVAVAVILSAVLTLGVQRAFQARAAQDQVEMSELRRLWPHPPAGAVFAPVSLALPPSPHSGPNKLDDHMWSALSAWWSARWCVRLAYRRSDIDCGHATWYVSAIQHADKRGADVQGVGRVPWASLLAFRVGPTGEIEAVTQVRLIRQGRPAAEFDVPLGRAAAQAAGQGEVVFELRR